MADFKFMAKMTRQRKPNYKCIWQNWKLHNYLEGKTDHNSISFRFEGTMQRYCSFVNSKNIYIKKNRLNF